jgi:hypothetical protein
MSEFRFFTKFDQTVLLGKRARNVADLLSLIKVVPDASIYYHTHRFLGHFKGLVPEPPNDFAYWVTEVLNEDVLAERMLSIDMVQYSTITELRAEFVSMLDDYLREARMIVNCPEGEEFHFMAARIFVMPTAYFATTPEEFAEAMAKVSVSTLFHHIFDAKLRLDRGENDFSAWFRDLGQPELALEIQQLDPYSYTLEGLRERIIFLVRQNGRHQRL